MWKEEESGEQRSEPLVPLSEPPPVPIQVTVPTAKRGVLILAGFFLLQIVVGIVFAVVLSVMYVAGGGNPADTEALTANMEGYAMQMNLLATYLASVILVLWLWRKANNPNDGISFPFLGVHRCGLASLARPAAVGAGLGFAYLVIGGLLMQAPEGSEFGPMTTLSRSSGWGLVMWVVTALLFAPPVEELLFRSVLLKSFLQSWPTPPASTLAIVATLVGFTAFHYQEFVYYPFAALAIFSMAAAATYFRLKTDNLLAAVTVHFFYNLSLVIALLLARASL